MNSKSFDAHYAEDADEAKKIVLGMIPENAAIGLGGSVTLQDMGLIDIFRNGPYNLIDRYRQPTNEARVAAMIFGPKRVIIVSGVNKVVPTIDDAMKRLKQIAPLNAKRIGHKTPCTETGKCEDCQIQARMCNYTTIIHHGMKFEGRISVIIVAEELGF